MFVAIEDRGTKTETQIQFQTSPFLFANGYKFHSKKISEDFTGHNWHIFKSHKRREWHFKSDWSKFKSSYPVHNGETWRFCKHAEKISAVPHWNFCHNSISCACLTHQLSSRYYWQGRANGKGQASATTRGLLSTQSASPSELMSISRKNIMYIS